MSMLPHWFSNERSGGGGEGGALNHLPLLFCKSVYSDCGSGEIQTESQGFWNLVKTSRIE